MLSELYHQGGMRMGSTPIQGAPYIEAAPSGPPAPSGSAALKPPEPAGLRPKPLQLGFALPNPCTGFDLFDCYRRNASIIQSRTVLAPQEHIIGFIKAKMIVPPPYRSLPLAAFVLRKRRDSRFKKVWLYTLCDSAHAEPQVFTSKGHHEKLVENSSAGTPSPKSRCCLFQSRSKRL